MKSKDTLGFLNEKYNTMNRYNQMSPFPPYDTDYVKSMKVKIEEVEKADIDYDEEPVVACKYCKSLHITTEHDDTTDQDYDVCNRCFTTNEVIEFENIAKYIEHLKEHGYAVDYESK